MLGVIRKAQDDQLDYDISFADWLTDGDVILDATATASDGLVVSSVEVFDQIVKVWLSGGANGATYPVIVTATTTYGRVKETRFDIRVTGC